LQPDVSLFLTSKQQWAPNGPSHPEGLAEGLDPFADCSDPPPTGARRSAGRDETHSGGNVHMRYRTCLLSVLPFTLGVALPFNNAAIAGDLPKEGTYSVTYFGAGTFKATPIGKQRVLLAWDENGLTVGTGLLDHMTWHCWGLLNIANGMIDWLGYCVATDPAGDQVASDVASDGKYPANAKSYKATGNITTGTGKYAGISGGWGFVGHNPEFRTAAEGTEVQYTTFQGSYKLP
jgi:hypothetical protein